MIHLGIDHHKKYSHVVDSRAICRADSRISFKPGIALQRIMMYHHIRRDLFGGPAVNKQTITFRLDPRRRKALDEIAAGMDRDRTYVLNEAIGNYLEVHQWQTDHIREGLRQANSGEFAKDADVAAALRRRRR